MKNQTEEIQIEGITIQVERKKIKNLYLRVHSEDGTVKMTVPLKTSREHILGFAKEKLDWIKKAQKKASVHDKSSKQEYQSGEIHFLWGKPYILDVVYGSRNLVYVDDNKIIMQLHADLNEVTAEQREKALEEFYRIQLKQAIPEMLKKCTNIVGKIPNECRVKNMKTRWGTCNVREKRIWLNLQLAKKSPECLEYVMIHELVHLYEREHNNRFRGYMDQFYPNWRRVKKILNE